MLKNRLLLILSISTLIVFALSAILTVPALADSGTTPPTTPSSSGGRTSNKGSSNSLSQVPSGTKVVVLDSSGNKVPLGSQAAQDIINSGDPIWCPTGIAPNFAGTSGCSESFDSIGDLVAGFTPHANGTIWVSYGSALAGAFINGGGTWNADKNFSLTIQGGWNDTAGSTALNTSNPYSTFSTPGDDGLEIVNWVGPVTINNAIFDSSPQISSGNFGVLEVHTQGNITLNNVQVYDADNTNAGNYASGAVLDNTSGTGSVTVTNSQFGENQHDGLDISSKGAITLNTVSANINGVGAELDNCLESGGVCQNHTASAVTITSSEFTLNESHIGDSGLQVDSNGAITLNAVTDVDNGFSGTGYGASLNNCNDSLIGTCSTMGKAVTITNSSLSLNKGDGLDVTSGGAISLNTVSADGNGGYGASLDNCNLFVGACTTNSQAITLTGTNIFDSNTGHVLDPHSSDVSGLDVLSGGTITTDSLEANDNTGGKGVELYNAGAASSLPVTVSAASNFSGNTNGDGLDIYSKGAISVTNLMADYNGGNGAYLDNINSSATPSIVTVSGTNGFNNNLYYDGLSVSSNGAISLNNITADYNGTGGVSGHYFDGIQADNSGAHTAQSITLTGNNDLSDNGYSGAEFTATGAVTLNDVNAVCNGYAGLDCISTQTGGVGLLIENDYLPSPSLHPQAVTLLGTNNISSNDEDNLDVKTFGAIKISNLTANDSDNGDGANLYFANGSSSDLTGAVTLSGTNFISDNQGADGGLNIDSNGAVSLSNITADGNGGGSGVNVENYYPGSAKPQSVTLLGTNNISSNYGDDLDVGSYGVVTISNLIANLSGTGDGVDLYSNSITSGNVTLKGVNTFNDDAGYGLYVFAKGTITASNLTANGTANGTGVELHNTSATSSAVTLTGSNIFNNNPYDGLDIYSNGTVILSTLTANGNGDTGVYIYNIPTSGSSTPAVTLTGTNTFNNDVGSGLLVHSKGAINASNLNAIGAIHISESDGVAFDTTGSVTLTGTNTFDDYGGDGLRVNAHGNITAGNLTAILDGYDGLFDYGVLLSTNGNVSLSGNNNFDDNYNDGIDILNKGTITTNNLTAENNNTGAGVVGDDAGVYIASNNSVTLNGTNTFLNNHIAGLDVFTNGAITVSNVTADGNGAFGANLGNSLGTNMAVTLTGTNVFLDNGATYYNTGGGNGLEINSDGAVSVSHITADDNYNDGMFVNTPGKVTVTCGSFTLNGRASGTAGAGGLGTGWETGLSVTSINLISTDSVGNYRGADQAYYNDGTSTDNFSSATCPLP
jgi:putative surface-exposed virulence protein